MTSPVTSLTLHKNLVAPGKTGDGFLKKQDYGTDEILSVSWFNVANVKMLPIPMLPITNALVSKLDIGNWQLATLATLATLRVFQESLLWGQTLPSL